MYIHLKIIAYVLMALAFVHVIFPRYFNWKEELKDLSLVNRQLMKVHTFFIALIVFLMGLLCAVSTREIIETHLGNIISLGLGLFWFCRLVIQFFGYSAELWKGKAFET
ncbi:MAG: hypothetical protein RLZZ30_1166, partial [Bacteroidota bacterium]